MWVWLMLGTGLMPREFTVAVKDPLWSLERRHNKYTAKYKVQTTEAAMLPYPAEALAE